MNQQIVRYSYFLLKYAQIFGLLQNFFYLIFNYDDG